MENYEHRAVKCPSFPAPLRSPWNDAPQPAPTLSIPTCAGDDDIHLTDYFTQLHHPESIHAGKERGIGTMRRGRKLVPSLPWGISAAPNCSGSSPGSPLPLQGHQCHKGGLCSSWDVQPSLGNVGCVAQRLEQPLQTSQRSPPAHYPIPENLPKPFPITPQQGACSPK